MHLFKFMRACVCMCVMSNDKDSRNIFQIRKQQYTVQSNLMKISWKCVSFIEHWTVNYNALC